MSVNAAMPPMTGAAIQALDDVVGGLLKLPKFGRPLFPVTPGPLPLPLPLPFPPLLLDGISGVESASALVLAIDDVAAETGTGTDTDTVTTLPMGMEGSGMVVGGVVVAWGTAVSTGAAVLGLELATVLLSAGGSALLTTIAESTPILSSSSDMSNVVFK